MVIDGVKISRKGKKIPAVVTGNANEYILKTRSEVRLRKNLYIYKPPDDCIIRDTPMYVSVIRSIFISPHTGSDSRGSHSLLTIKDISRLIQESATDPCALILTTTAIWVPRGISSSPIHLPLRGKRLYQGVPPIVLN